MTTAQTGTDPSSTANYDNNGQYTRRGILRYEKIFGYGYISTGGPETTLHLCSLLGDALRPGVRVLDVGSGIGGAGFHLAREYGAHVTGIDLSPEMVAIAQERAATEDLGTKGGTMKTLLGDVMKIPQGETFDIVWSRDALMHVHDKDALFARLFELTAPGGRLVITDYGRGTGEGSPEFRAYIEKTGYHVLDPASYGKLLEKAGYVDVVATDATDLFLDIMRRESERLAAHPDEFLAAFGEEDLKYLRDRWAMKDGFCKAGDMKWGIYKASKP